MQGFPLRRLDALPSFLVFWCVLFCILSKNSQEFGFELAPSQLGTWGMPCTQCKGMPTNTQTLLLAPFHVFLFHARFF